MIDFTNRCSYITNNKLLIYTIKPVHQSKDENIQHRLMFYTHTNVIVNNYYGFAFHF
jgi:hypothetical protein